MSRCTHPAFYKGDENHENEKKNGLAFEFDACLREFYACLYTCSDRDNRIVNHQTNVCFKHHHCGHHNGNYHYYGNHHAQSLF